MTKRHTGLILSALFILVLFLVPTQLNAQPYMLLDVADRETLIPGGSGDFDSFDDLVSSETTASEAFIGTGSTSRGIYAYVDGVLTLAVDTFTPIPGGSGNFEGFHTLVSLGGEDFAFIGFGGGQAGIYTYIGGVLSVAVDTNTPIPGGTDTFADFFFPISLGDGDLAFVGIGFPAQEGLYTYIDGVLSVVVDTNTPIPGGTGNFQGNQFPISLGGGNVAFKGFGSGGQDGIYAYIEGILSVIADENTPIPGGSGNFVTFDNLVSLGGSDIAFEGFGLELGIYTYIGGLLGVAADTNTAIPMGSGNFTSFSAPVSLGGGDIAFVGLGSGSQEGIYTDIGGTLAFVADKNTPIPGGSGNFANFQGLVSLGGGNIAFQGEDSSTDEGIYTYIGTVLAVVADTNTAIPMGSGNFADFGFPVFLDSGDLAFFGAAGGQQGIYLYSGSVLTLVADLDTAIPMGSGDFTNIGAPISLDSGDLAFLGSGSMQTGVYSYTGGVLSLVADTNTPIPMGSGNFENFGIPVDLGGGDVAFQGSGSGQSGIYTYIGGVLSLVADRNTTIPLGSENFLSFQFIVSLGGGDLAFRGEGIGEEGIYTYIGGVLSVVADRSTAAPMGSGNFTSFERPVSLGGGDVAFVANSTGNLGIYAYTGGTLILVADLNTTVPMGSGTFADFGFPVSLGGGDIVFVALTSTSETSIYKYSGGTLTVLVDESTPIPGGSGNFTSFGSAVSLGGGNIVFTGAGSSGQGGIYTYIGGVVSLVVDKNTPIPGGSGNFAGANGQISLGNGEIGFRGIDSSLNRGIYSYANGMINVVADTNTMIPGGTGSFLDLDFPISLGSGNLAFFGSGTGQMGVYNAYSGPLTLNIALAGEGVGNVSAPGIDCGNGGVDCTEDYPLNTEVTLVAIPDPVSEFVGFSGNPDCEDGMVTMNASKTCTATFEYLPLILNPIYPGVASNPNIITVEQATPGGKVAYIWSFLTGSTTIGGPTCNGLELGLKNPQLLGFKTAGDNQTADFIVYIPLNPAFDNPVYTQAVDVPTCRKSEVVQNIILSE